MRRLALAAVVLSSVLVFYEVVRAARAFQSARAEFHQVPAPVSAPVPGTERVTWQTRDGTKLAGWLLPSRNGAAVVFSHGSPGDRTNLLPEARAVARGGTGALLIDYPGYGESGGQVGWGTQAQEALSSAIDFLARAPGVDPGRLGGFGFSMGGWITCAVAARDLRLRAIVLAGTFTDYRAAHDFEYRYGGALTAFSSALALQLEPNLPLEQMRPIDLVAAIAPRPLLIVHGTRDQAVPVAMAHALAARAGLPKDLLLIEGGGHGDYARTGDRAYLDRIEGFFEQALAPR